MSEIVETPVVAFPGWIKVDDRETRTIRYRSPDGVVIPRSRFLKLQEKYTEGRIPPEELLEASKRPPSFFQSTPSNKASSKRYEKQAQAPVDGAEQEEFPEHISDLKPKPSSRANSSKKPRPSATMLSIGIRRLAILITNVIVFRMLEDERAKLTDQEATALGIALGNLLEPTQFNEQWGWIIADTGDWQTIGYIMVVYFSRIADIVKDKRNAGRPNAETSPEQSIFNGANGNAGTTNGRQGAALPYSNQSIRGFAQTPESGNR